MVHSAEPRLVLLRHHHHFWPKQTQVPDLDMIAKPCTLAPMCYSETAPLWDKKTSTQCLGVHRMSKTLLSASHDPMYVHVHTNVPASATIGAVADLGDVGMQCAHALLTTILCVHTLNQLPLMASLQRLALPTSQEPSNYAYQPRMRHVCWHMHTANRRVIYRYSLRRANGRL